MRQMRILWIDDDEYLLDFCSRSLRNRGAMVHIATSGEQGIELLREIEVDVIVSDLEMGEMDGLEVARKVHELFSGSRRLKPKFVLLTAWVKEMGPEEALKEFNVNTILEKPIEMKTLFQTLCDLVKHNSNLNLARSL